MHQWDLREERMNVGGHFIYERHRALFEACESVFGSAVSTKLKDLNDHCELVEDQVQPPPNRNLSSPLVNVEWRRKDESDMSNVSQLQK